MPSLASLTQMMPAGVRSWIRASIAVFAARALSMRGLSLEPDIRVLADATPFDVVVDVGANLGERAERFAKQFPNATIHCIEPVPELVGQLKQRLTRFNCHVHQVAISDVTGQACMAKQETNGLFTLKEPKYLESRLQPVETLAVPTLTLDDFCCQQKIDKVSFLKIDAGGDDFAVLIGGSWASPVGKCFHH